MEKIMENRKKIFRKKSWKVGKNFCQKKFENLEEKFTFNMEKIMGSRKKNLLEKIMETWKKNSTFNMDKIMESRKKFLPEKIMESWKQIPSFRGSMIFSMFNIKKTMEKWN